MPAVRRHPLGRRAQALELARALMSRPRLLLLDEPMAGVNPTMGLRCSSTSSVSGLTTGHVLFVEHDLEVVMRHAEQVIVMAGGTVYRGRPAGADPEGPARARRATWAAGATPDTPPGPAVMADAVLRAQALVAGYLPGVDIVRGLDLAVAQGEMVAVWARTGQASRH